MFFYPDAGQFLGIPIQRLNHAVPATGSSIDTRTLKPGDLFVALPGTKTDGHTFLEEAFKKGASGALISQKVYSAERERFLAPPSVFQNLLVVKDVEQSLTSLAAWHRLQFKIPMIGITGSVGKTTTKEFLYYLLKKRYVGLANSGNFNNHLGLPLTLLRLNKDHQFCVSELGANHRYEIRHLAGILRPTAGIITQIATVHLEGFGSLDVVYNTKMELFEALHPKSVAVLPDYDAKLLGKANALPLDFITVGKSHQADCCVSEIKAENGWVCFCVNGTHHFRFPSSAPFLAINAAMALAMAETCGIDMKDVPEVWDDLVLPTGRFQETSLGNGVRLINDGYNANPVSFRGALEAFNAMDVKGRKILVFADMLELGDLEYPYHEELGREISKYHLDVVAGYGRLAQISMQVLGERTEKTIIKKFENSQEVTGFLEPFLRPGDAVLFKASNGMKVYEICNHLMKTVAATTNRGEGIKR